MTHSVSNFRTSKNVELYLAQQTTAKLAIPRTLKKLLVLLALTFSASGCVSTTLDLDNRGNVPISSKLLSTMRDKEMTPSAPVLVRIFKMESELEVWKKNQTGQYALLNTYPMCRWSGQLGPKKAEGDRQAPEGIYSVTTGRLNPKSKFHLSFDLGYPNRLESALGYTGSALMVHGACSSSGCFAITDESVSEVYAIIRDALKAGQKSVQVHSFPFRLTPENLAQNRDNKNFDFWINLKNAYDFFEVRRQEPKIHFCDGAYRFGELADDSNILEDPLASCPKFADPDPTVAAKTEMDIVSFEILMASSPNGTTIYADGGMHPIFREILTKRGVEVLTKKSSRTLVPVSRPGAALMDSYIAE